MFKINSGLVRKLLFERGLSLKAFAAQSGLNALTVRKLVRGGAKVSAKTISALAKFFNVNGEDFVLKNSPAEEGSK